MYAHMMSRRKVSTTIYITPEQNEQLKLLHNKTKVPIAEYIRQGIDLILEKHKAVLPGQQRLGVQRVPHVPPYPVNTGGHDAVVRPHLAPEPRAEPRTGQRVRRPGYLPVIGPRDDVAPGVAGSAEDLVTRSPFTVDLELQSAE